MMKWNCDKGEVLHSVELSPFCDNKVTKELMDDV